MDYTISRDASGNEVTEWNYPEFSHGDAAECHAEPPTCGCECGREVTIGSSHDPYGATCERAVGHRGPHCGADPFGADGYYEWTGGGYCAGDPLPVRGRFVEEMTS